MLLWCVYRFLYLQEKKHHFQNANSSIFLKCSCRSHDRVCVRFPIAIFFLHRSSSNRYNRLGYIVSCLSDFSSCFAKWPQRTVGHCGATRVSILPKFCAQNSEPSFKRPIFYPLNKYLQSAHFPERRFFSCRKLDTHTELLPLPYSTNRTRSACDKGLGKNFPDTAKKKQNTTQTPPCCFHGAYRDQAFAISHVAQMLHTFQNYVSRPFPGSYCATRRKWFTGHERQTSDQHFHRTRNPR